MQARATHFTCAAWLLPILAQRFTPAPPHIHARTVTTAAAFDADGGFGGFENNIGIGSFDIDRAGRAAMCGGGGGPHWQAPPGGAGGHSAPVTVGPAFAGPPAPAMSGFHSHGGHHALGDDVAMADCDLADLNLDDLRDLGSDDLGVDAFLEAFAGDLAAPGDDGSGDLMRMM